MRESRQMAEVLMDRMGADAATGKGGAALIQMLTTLTTDYMVRRIDNPDTEMEVDDLRALSRAIKERAQAARATQDYDVKLREQIKLETVQVVESSAREAGLSAATINAIKSRILGVSNG